MQNATNERVYPTSPLEAPIIQEQKQALLRQPPPPPPPTYDQATTGLSTTTSGGHEGSHVVIITQPPPLLYGPHPVDVQCPYCQNYTRTRIRRQPTTRTHLLAFLLCLLQLYCCICLPYCFGTFMVTNHYCGICDHYLGTYGLP